MELGRMTVQSSIWSQPSGDNPSLAVPGILAPNAFTEILFLCTLLPMVSLVPEVAFSEIFTHQLGRFLMLPTIVMADLQTMIYHPTPS